MEIEAGLPHGHDMGVLQQLAQPLLGIWAPALCVVGMNPGRRDQPWLNRCHGQRGFGPLARLADHHDPGHTRVPRPLQNLGKIRSVGRVCQVAVSVDQQSGATGRRGCGAARSTRANTCPAEFTRRSVASGWPARREPSWGPGAPERRDRASAARSPSGPAKRCRSRRRFR